MKNIKANVLNLSAQRDHIALPCQVEALLEHISSTDKEYVSIPTGHVSIVYGGTAVKQTYPTIGDWLEKNVPNNEEKLANRRVFLHFF
ncbi:hypothetical protein GCM10020331_072660 [Ectobacillus funiculus]